MPYRSYTGKPPVPGVDVCYVCRARLRRDEPCSALYCTNPDCPKYEPPHAHDAPEAVPA